MESITVLCHLYYEHSLDLLNPYLQNLLQYKAAFFFNISSETDYCESLGQTVKNSFPDSVITVSPNIGKDIGGKLVLLDTYLKLNKHTTYLVLLHDKISPHSSTGTAWRKKLLTILEINNINKIITEFQRDSSIGLIANKDLILNEFDKKTQNYTCTSNEKLNLLKKEYNINNKDHEFVGGTMYWVKSEIYKTFFIRYAPLSIRSTLERGDVLDHNSGSYTHAWERLLSWIITDQGYNIKGI